MTAYNALMAETPPIPPAPLPPPMPPAAPQPPVQVFPPPDMDDPHVTATEIRDLREEILRDLEEDSTPPAQISWRAVQLALLVLLLVSLGVIAVIWNASVPGASADPVEQVGEAALDSDLAPDLPNAHQPQELTPPTPPTPSGLKSDGLSPALRTRLGEIELINQLLGEDRDYDPRVALERLTPYTNSLDRIVREKAEQALKPVHALMEQQARASARQCAEQVEELVESGDYPQALKLLDTQLRAMPSDVPWVKQHGLGALQGLQEKLTRQRQQQHAAAFAGLADALRAESVEASDQLERLTGHPDPLFRTRALELQGEIAAEKAQKLAEARRREELARSTWFDFFDQFAVAVSNSDFQAALKLTHPALTSPLFMGGTPSGAEVLKGFAADLEGIQALYELALFTAAGDRRTLTLVQRGGRRQSGTLQGIEGRQLQLKSAGAVVGVKVESLTGATLKALIPAEAIQEKKLQPALWALQACDDLARAEEALKKAYANAPLPLHWQEFIRLDKLRRREVELAQRFDELKKALESKQLDAIRQALDAARPAVLAYEELDRLSDYRKQLLADADKLASRFKRDQVILQNGVSPTENYDGELCDQISDYRDSQKKCDVGVQYGLKLGASGGLQRILIRFDGMEAAIDKARVRSASLELYQIESPQATGSVIAVYRLKRSWVPNDASWLSYDAPNNRNWSTPGAAGDDDREPKEVARLVVDSKRNLWRSFDVTAYVQDVLSGKAQNNGLLLRVINNEPEHHVRFYPEGDLENKQDKSLRPRLVLTVEREER